MPKHFLLDCPPRAEEEATRPLPLPVSARVATRRLVAITQLRLSRARHAVEITGTRYDRACERGWLLEIPGRYASYRQAILEADRALRAHHDAMRSEAAVLAATTEGGAS